MSSAGAIVQPRSHVTSNSQISGWYSCNSAQSLSEKILVEAYENAKSLFETELTDDEDKRVIVRDKSSLEDLQQVLADAKAKYDAKQTSTAREWLGIFSSKVMFYAGVFDVLIQQYPQYVSLAWGAMRFLFAGVVNHEEMIRRLCESFSQIADILPSTDLSLILYPTEMMKDAVARLHAYIIRFVIHAVRWYKQGKFAHAWAAIAKPWALSFKGHLDDISRQAEMVKELAHSASRAEYRDAHLEMRETHDELQKAREELRDARLEIKRTHIDLQKVLEYIQNASDKSSSDSQHLIQMALVSQSVHAQMQLDLSQSKTMIANIQLAQILTMPFAEHLPASGECLRFCQSMVKRTRRSSRFLLPDTTQLQAWSDLPRSSFLIVQSTSAQVAKAFLVNLVDLIREKNFRILWTLRFPDYWERKLTNLDILRMLVIQSLQINPQALTPSEHPIKMTHLREAVDEKDWLVLLNRALTGLSSVYIILDADLLSHATGKDRYAATKLIEAFPIMITSTVVKLIVSNAGLDEEYASRHWDPNCWSKLKTDSGNGRFSQRGRGKRAKRVGQRRLDASRSCRR